MLLLSKKYSCLYVSFIIIKEIQTKEMLKGKGKMKLLCINKNAVMFYTHDSCLGYLFYLYR